VAGGVRDGAQAAELEYPSCGCEAGQAPGDRRYAGPAEVAAASAFTGVATWCAEGAPATADHGAGNPAGRLVSRLRRSEPLPRYAFPHPRGRPSRRTSKRTTRATSSCGRSHRDPVLHLRPRLQEGVLQVHGQPRGYFSDQWWMSGTPGAEDLWTSGAAMKCKVSDEAWTWKWPSRSRP